MQTRTSSLRSRPVVVSLFFFILLIFQFPPEVAGQSTQDTVLPFQVKYMGDVQGLPLIQIDFDNWKKEIYDLRIEDAEGLDLYDERLSDMKISRKFQMNFAGEFPKKLFFTLYSIKSKKYQTVEVNLLVIQKQEVSITKL